MLNLMKYRLSRQPAPSAAPAALTEPRLFKALTGLAVLLEGLVSAADPMAAWSQYQTLWDEAEPAYAGGLGRALCVDFPGADRRAYLLRRALGNLAPAGMDFSALERVRVRLALLRAHAPVSFDPDAEARGDIDAALLQTVDAIVRQELRIRWERASLIRGREIPQVDDL
jgi:hypothetical protein